MGILAKVRQLYEVSDEGNRLLSMEGLRGFAVLLVFFVHFDALFGGYVVFHPILHSTSVFLGSIGNTGVDLFFVLSGYLIYGALIRRKAAYLGFIRRRVQRIYPTFLVVFCAYVTVSTVFPSESKIHGSFLSSSLFILENVLLLPGIFKIIPIITVAWSLSYEFFFYLTLPVLVSLTRMREWKSVTRVGFFAGFWLVFVLYACTLPASHLRMLMFVAGILLYELMDSAWLVSKLSRAGEILVIFGFLASLLFTYFSDAQPQWFRMLLPVQGPYKVVVLSVSCVLLTLYSFKFDGILNAIFSWSPLRYLGNMSYSYYLLHGLTLHGFAMLVGHVAPTNKPSVAAFLFSLACGFATTWIAATLLFSTVEKPFSLKRNAKAKTVIAGSLQPENRQLLGVPG